MLVVKDTVDAGGWGVWSLAREGGDEPGTTGEVNDDLSVEQGRDGASVEPLGVVSASEKSAGHTPTEVVALEPGPSCRFGVLIDPVTCAAARSIASTGRGGGGAQNEEPANK